MPQALKSQLQLGKMEFYKVVNETRMNKKWKASINKSSKSLQTTLKCEGTGSFAEGLLTIQRFCDVKKHHSVT